MFKELSIFSHRTYVPADIDAAVGILNTDQRVLRPLMSGTVAPDDVQGTIEALRDGRGMKFVVECPT